jgi:hypothetical protein
MGYSLRITGYVFQLAIQIFSIKITFVGAVRSGMLEQNHTSDGAHDEVSQLTTVFAIHTREGNGQFLIASPR